MGCGSTLRELGRDFDDGLHVAVDSVSDFILEDLLGIPTDEDIQDQIDKNKGVLLNKSSNIEKIPVVYGNRRMGGVRVFVGVSGSTKEYLHIVLAIAEGEIESIDTVYIDDTIYSDEKFSDVLQISNYTGTTSQAADPTLVSAFTSWTPQHQLKGVVYLAIRFSFNQEVFSSFPRITCDIRGKRVLDVRDSVVKYTANNALCVYDYLTNRIYGKGLSDNDINIQSIIDAANYCDLQYQSYFSGPNIAYFECNGIINTDNTLLNNVRLLLNSFRAKLPYVAGQYVLFIEKDEPSTFDFNADNIADGSWTFSGNTKQNKINLIKVTYLNPAKDWQQDLVIQSNAQYLLDDNDIKLEKTVSLPLETNQFRAKYRAETILKKSREGLSVGFVGLLKTRRVESGDVVTITHKTPGWDGKLFRVVNCRLMPTGNTSFNLVEHQASVYDRTVPVGVASGPDTNLPDPYSTQPPSALQAFSGTNELLQGSDGSIASRIRLTWAEAPDAFVHHYQIQYKKGSDSTYLDAIPAIGRSSTETFILGVQDSVLYDVRVRAINSRGVSSVWDSITRLVIGKTEPPPDVNEFLISQQLDGTRQFSWAYYDKQVDHGGYEIRYRSGSTATWETMAALHVDPLRSSPWETNQLPAGQYIFAIKALDDTGNESENALYIPTDLGDPRITGKLDEFDVRALGWPGIIINGWVDETGYIVPTSKTTWDDLTTWDAWTSSNLDPHTVVTYEHNLYDIAAITTFRPLITLEAKGSASLEIQHSLDNVTYSNWAAADGSEITARYVRIRVTATDATGAYIYELKVVFAARPIEELIEDLDTSTITQINGQAGHVKLPVSLSYAAIRGVSITLQSVGAGWSSEIISKGDLINGPEIRIYNASGISANATIDAFIRGI
ncbi:MAG: hypothetical protein JKX76_04310 [Colwellia sp.]|nr:hypothetical protein [Colwellia sp.]